jgi:hypothetical protein
MSTSEEQKQATEQELVKELKLLPDYAGKGTKQSSSFCNEQVEGKAYA